MLLFHVCVVSAGRSELLSIWNYFQEYFATYEEEEFSEMLKEDLPSFELPVFMHLQENNSNPDQENTIEPRSKIARALIFYKLFSIMAPNDSSFQLMNFFHAFNLAFSLKKVFLLVCQKFFLLN